MTPSITSFPSLSLLPFLGYVFILCTFSVLFFLPLTFLLLPFHFSPFIFLLFLIFFLFYAFLNLKYHFFILWLLFFLPIFRYSHLLLNPFCYLLSFLHSPLFNFMSVLRLHAFIHLSQTSLNSVYLPHPNHL
jgi:hypothetical protein